MTDFKQRHEIYWICKFKRKQPDKIFDATIRKQNILLELLQMLGVHGKILSAFLLLSLFFSASHMCAEQLSESSRFATVQLTDNAPTAQDLASNETSSHACHLGCCPILFLRAKDFQFARKDSPLKIGYARYRSRLISMDLFRPPIA